MAREQLKTLTEPMYYLLLALITPQHGYGIMQSIAALTEDRVQVGAGTLYALLARFEAEGIISQILVKDRKKIYQITPKGADVLAEEFCRLNQMVEDGKGFFDRKGTLLPVTYEKAEQEAEQSQPALEEAPKEPRVEEQEAEKGAPETGEPEEKEKTAKDLKQKEKKKGIGRGLRKGIFAT